jgi:hypothetical protein
MRIHMNEVYNKHTAHRMTAAAICKKIGALKQQACLISRVSPSLAPTVA